MGLKIPESSRHAGLSMAALIASAIQEVAYSERNRGQTPNLNERVVFSRPADGTRLAMMCSSGCQCVFGHFTGVSFIEVTDWLN